MSAQTSRPPVARWRSFGPMLAIFIVLGLALWFFVERSWLPAEGPASTAPIDPTLIGGPLVDPAVTGGSLSAWLRTSTWLVLVAIVGLIPTGGRFRQVINGVLALAGLVAAVAALVTGLTMNDGTPASWWFLPATMLGLLIFLFALAALPASRHWPTMSGRYDRTSKDRPAMSMWDSLNEGHDPTVDDDPTSDSAGNTVR